MTTDATVLDHLAVAAEHGFDLFARYYGELGGTYVDLSWPNPTRPRLASRSSPV